MPLGLLFASALAIVLGFGATAHADGTARWAVDWAKLGDVIRDIPGSVLPPQRRQIPTESGSPLADEPDNAWRPGVSLVARDWGGTQLLLGHLSLIDQLRLIRSIRMVVTRVRFGTGPIVPFLHLGLGQWRVDTDLMPALPRDVEVATQLASGCEFAFSRTFALAVEADHTYLIRDQRQPQMVASPHLWGASLAARAVF